MKTKFVQLFIALTASFGFASAQSGVILSDKSGWHRIGQKTVDFSTDRDEIAVTVADRFAAIKFLVKDAPINLNELEITFESGDNQKIKINNSVKKEGESRVIDIKGSERNIKKILFTYSTLPNFKDKKARVEIWGLKTNANRKPGSSKNEIKDQNRKEAMAPTGHPKVLNHESPTGSIHSDSKMDKATSSTNPESSKFGADNNDRVSATPSFMTSDKSGWHRIAIRTVEFSNDRDEIMVVGANRFSSIKFKSLDAPIFIMAVKMNYDKGEIQEYGLNTQLDPGKESVDISLNEGKERDLNRISFFYKTVPNFQDKKANLEVWGYKTNDEVQSKK